MKVSIIMTVYNESINLVKNSVKSVINQTYDDLELIIISDNPKNYRLNEYIVNLSRENNNIRTIFNKQNYGQSKARNIGIKSSNGDYIAILDADDVSNPYRIQNEMDFLIHNKLDFVFSNFSVSYINKYGNKNIVRKSSFKKENITDQKYLKNIFINDYNVTLHSSWLVKKNVYECLHGYRELIPVEDFDLLLRSMVYGFKLGYISDILVEKIEREYGVSKQNLFFQYEDAKILQNYAKKHNLKKVISMDEYKIIHDNTITKSGLKKFVAFNRNLQMFKEKQSMKIFLKLLVSLFSSVKTMNYIYNKIRLKLKGY